MKLWLPGLLFIYFYINNMPRFQSMNIYTHIINSSVEFYKQLEIPFIIL